MLGHFEVAVVDLLMEGKYAELGRETPEHRGFYVSFVWACATSGGLVGSILVGVLADSGHIYSLLWTSTDVHGVSWFFVRITSRQTCKSSPLLPVMRTDRFVCTKTRKN